MNLRTPHPRSTVTAVVATLFALLLLYPFTLFALNEADLLQAEEAFPATVTVISPEKVRVEWEIADGYYLYRHKFKISTESETTTLGEPLFPAGKKKNDEFFGEIETYRHQVAIDLPLIRHGIEAEQLVLNLTSQGCADIGVCYPPFSQTKQIQLPPRSEQKNTAAEDLKTLFNRQSDRLTEDEILEPDEAFRFTALAFDSNTMIARWDIAPEHYLYRSKFTFSLENGPEEEVAATISSVETPSGETKNDEFFGEIEVYHNQVEAIIHLERQLHAAASVTLNVSYQGCAERGICYPPIQKSTRIDLPPVVPSAVITTAE
ncbi:MAG: thiol:disulfide interchange protein, partial [Gammaproteobacteria bacterium]|nr:thiol:disulfide interchange protein [Gammaproteobacteria bacterium]